MSSAIRTVMPKAFATTTIRSRSMVARNAPAPRRSVAVKASAGITGDGQVRCFINGEGHLVCEKLEPGDYVIHEAPVQEHEEGMSMPACSIEDSVACGTYCYIDDDGSVFCEGLPTGDYTIEAASDKDIENLMKKAGISTEI